MIIKCRVCGGRKTKHDTSARVLIGICGHCAKKEREVLTALSSRYPQFNPILRYMGKSALIARVAKR